MKKAVLIAVLLVAAASWVAAGEMGEPNFFYEPGSLGLILPEDTQQSEEEGTMYYSSESEKLMVIITELDPAMKDSDLLNEKKFIAALKELGATDIKAGSYGTGEITLYSASVTMNWEDGSVDKGFMAIVNNPAVKGKSFVVGVFGPSQETSYDNPAFFAIDSLSFATAP